VWVCVCVVKQNKTKQDVQSDILCRAKFNIYTYNGTVVRNLLINWECMVEWFTSLTSNNKPNNTCEFGSRPDTHLK
jgi:hypothetical protein